MIRRVFAEMWRVDPAGILYAVAIISGALTLMLWVVVAVRLSA